MPQTWASNPFYYSHSSYYENQDSDHDKKLMQARTITAQCIKLTFQALETPQAL